MEELPAIPAAMIHSGSSCFMLAMLNVRCHLLVGRWLPAHRETEDSSKDERETPGVISAMVDGDDDFLFDPLMRPSSDYCSRRRTFLRHRVSFRLKPAIHVSITKSILH
jgi:hypothetical protein